MNVWQLKLKNYSQRADKPSKLHVKGCARLKYCSWDIQVVNVQGSQVKHKKEAFKLFMFATPAQYYGKVGKPRTERGGQNPELGLDN